MANEINILWASMSGTAEDVAKNFETKASDMGFVHVTAWEYII